MFLSISSSVIDSSPPNGGTAFGSGLFSVFLNMIIPIAWNREVALSSVPSMKEMIRLVELQNLCSTVSGYADALSPYLGWIRDNWLLLVLTGEIVGAVLAIKVGLYRRGIFWLLAALATIWVGAIR